MSDMLWKKAGCAPGSVTVMEGAAPGGWPAGAASREPSSWARFPSAVLSGGCPTVAVLVVWVDVCPEVWGDDGGLTDRDMGSPGEGRKTPKNKVDVYVTKSSNYNMLVEKCTQHHTYLKINLKIKTLSTCLQAHPLWYNVSKYKFPTTVSQIHSFFFLS